MTIGKQASCAGDHAVAIGDQAEATEYGCIAIGLQATALSDNSSVAVGREAATNGSLNVAIGYQTASNTGGSFNTVLGARSYCLDNTYSSVSVGTYATCAGNRGVAIGYSAYSNHNESVCIGKRASSTQANELVLNVSGGVSPSLRTQFTVSGGAPGATTHTLQVFLNGTEYEIALTAV